MKKQIPAILLAIICIILGATLLTARKETAKLRRSLADATKQIPEPVQPAEEVIIPQQTVKKPTAIEPEEPVPPVVENSEPGRRMMSSMAKMLDNPTMSKVMEASQRGAVGALYADMIEYLGLNAEETKYFMDILMNRQMKNINLSMKMISGNLSAEEKAALADELKQVRKSTNEEMEKFLNNKDDVAEWKFYEKTMGERMMLSQMDKNLAGTSSELNDESYRALLGMMHEEKINFDFTTDLQDEKNTDMSPERFSKENLANFSTDMDALNTRIIQRAQNMLTPDQLNAFETAIKTTSDMQKAQLEMASQMFGGNKN